MFGKKELPTTAIVPLDEVPSHRAAVARLIEIQSKRAALEAELKAAHAACQEAEPNIDCMAEDFLAGRDPLAAVAMAPPAGRAAQTIEAELAAADQAAEIQKTNVSKARRTAILAELDKKEHRQALEALAAKVADHLVAIDEAHNEADRFYQQFVAGGYRRHAAWFEQDFAHGLDSLTQMLVTTDLSLAGQQSFLRAMGLRLVETGLVAAKHPIVAKLQKRL
jgi:hypothetical protein